MAAKQVTDKFANIAYLRVEESAANTLTYAQLQIAANLIGTKYAMIINRIWYMFETLNTTIFNAAEDFVTFGLSVSDRVTDLGDLSQPEILDIRQIKRTDFGAAATGEFLFQPFETDFSTIPGGGVLVPADRLFIGVKGSGLTAAATVHARIWYTIMEIQPADYLELIEARHILTT